MRSKITGRLFACVLLGVCVWACAGGNCHARLGETEKQLVARYGEAELLDLPENAWDDKTLTFSVDGPAGGSIGVFAYMLDGVSVSENYIFFNADGSKSVMEGKVYEAAKAIIQANAEGNTWRGLPGLPPPGIEILWVRSDNRETTAVVWKNQPNVLEVTRAEAHLRQMQHKTGLKGF